MKKVLLIMAAALMTMTQCRKQETVPAMPSANTIKMTITAGPGAKTIIDDNGTIKWSKDDKLYVSNGTNWLGSLDLVGEGGSPSGTFTGDISEISDGTTCHFFYLGHDNGMTPPTKNTATEVSISFASQDGSKVGAFKYHLGHGKAVVTVSGGVATGEVTMSTEIAIAHLKLKMNDADYTGPVTMDVSNTMTVSPAGTFSGSGNGIDIGNNGGTSGDRYVTLIPTEATNVNFSGFATGSMTFGHGIQANNLYGMTNGIKVTLTATHEYVDLGLSVKWATCNLGASKPEEYGYYYAWGETSTKSVYTWDNYKWCNGSSTTLIKYNNNPSYGTVDGKTTLESSDDAARANWGGDWRMPTAAELTDLKNNTTRTWKAAGASIEIGGQIVSMPVAGYYYVGKKSGYTDKYIFLPAAGYRYGTSPSTAGSEGYYWSSSLGTSSPSGGRYLNFSSSNCRMSDGTYRYRGSTVRPVQ